MKHVPNTVTIVRILLTPLVLGLLFVDTLAGRTWALALFVVASLSDWVDGKLARHYEVPSRLGQFLDPLADKILVLGTFIALAVLDPRLVPWWAVALVAVRDVGVTLLRIRSSRSSQPVRTSGAAKVKTAFQLTFLIAVLLLLASAKLPPAVADQATRLLHGWLVRTLLLATVAATILTGAAYFRRPTDAR